MLIPRLIQNPVDISHRNVFSWPELRPVYRAICFMAETAFGTQGALDHIGGTLLPRIFMHCAYAVL